MQEFLTILFGQLSVGAFLAYLALMMIGVVINATLDVSQRDKQSPNTPVKFSWWFFIRDNAKRFAGTILVLFICIRFSEHLFGSEPLDWMMVVLGYNADSLMQFVKNKTSILSADRAKLFEQP